MYVIQHALHEYKSKLFDLIYEEMSVGADHSVQLQKWLTVVKDCLEIDQAFLYFYTDSAYFLYQPHHNGGVPLTLAEATEEYILRPILIEKEDLSSIKFHFTKSDGSPLAILQVKKEDSKRWADESWLHSFWKASNQFLQHTGGIQTVLEDERRYRELFKVTEIFHSTRDVHTLLVQVIETLKQVFPIDEFRLLLSNDRHDFGELPIKSFDFERANESAMQAFVNGTIESGEEDILYAPLKGKQGIYGVLEVESASLDFTDQKIEFIRLLAYTAGSALENAKLYEQSKRLITDLQLINETSHQLNLNLRLSETVQFLKKQIKRSFQASAIGFVLLQKGEYTILDESSPVFFEEIGRSFISYVKKRIEEERDSIFLGDVGDRFEGAGAFPSIMAAPMVQNEALIGFCVVLHKEPYMFSFDMYKLLQSFIHHSTLAITNATLREKLEHMVITDHMTKLFARNYLDDEMESSMNKDELGTLLLIDIDDFKSINDNYGHQIGDEVIIEVSNLIKGIVSHHGFVARWGGEELAVYLPSLGRKEGMEIAERIIKDIPLKTDPSVTLSCGLSIWKADDDHCPKSVKELVKKADEALYLAKNNGKNQVVKDCQ
ncbi:sensor domain-containing diguanylate cyclase [Rossellomorea vietnamensis]|uniref:Sensor domain-containing diguanylate cyclase n=1 Tax=Rossellomorea vietnamensis TaxID=218284 RepID=A0ACD4C5M1_9BACI|nr:sensor domain-containing diguanylate cyclase [Rossellomorea vietnamensis]UXH43855.1 sensor domain-containing diguanylate cyclase [Rossellomorea vietnamensis]